MLRDIAVTIDDLYKSHEETPHTEDDSTGILHKLVEGIKRHVTCHEEPTLVDQIIATVNLAEAQKQVNEDHSATHKILGIINDIEELANQMTHLKTQAKKNEMMSILLNISPGSLAHAAYKGRELAIDVGEIAEELAAAGKKIISFGETVLKIGGIASLLGEKSGWIPGIGTVSSEVEKAGEAVEKTGTITTWVGELLEDLDDPTATVSAQAGELALRLGGSDSHAADVNIQMSLFPVNIEKMVRGGVTASLENGSEMNVSLELRSKATTYETQIKAILAAVHEDNDD